MMTERISSLKDYFFDGKHHTVRRTPQMLGLDTLAVSFSEQNLPASMRASMMLEAMLDAERAVIFDGEQIVATRTITSVPSIFTEGEWKKIKESHYLHENGMLSNISPNFGAILEEGLESRKQRFMDRAASADAEGKLFVSSVVKSIEALQKFIQKYESCAVGMGKHDLAQVLHNIRAEGAGTFHEALQLLRFVHYGLWASGCYHTPSDGLTSTCIRTIREILMQAV